MPYCPICGNYIQSSKDWLEHLEDEEGHGGLGGVNACYEICCIDSLLEELCEEFRKKQKEKEES